MWGVAGAAQGGEEQSMEQSRCMTLGLHMGLHYCSEGTVRALDDRGTLSPVGAGD